jgi:tRNA (cytidine/uridine-2'-O-)-methyltransferase
MFNVVLVNPQIPPNTGNIGRLCVNTGARLHLVKPLGFSIEDKDVKRAGLDYWQKLDLRVWESLEEFVEANANATFHLATTKTDRLYFDVRFSPGDFLIFGSETSGLPDWFLRRYRERAITIPMCKEGRSLNLAVSVGIVLYEAIRQNFKEFCR